jgi:hypothetical protein
MEGVCSRVLLKMLNRSLDLALCKWKDRAQEQRRAERVAKKVLKHWTQRTAAGAFESLHAVVLR